MERDGFLAAELDDDDALRAILDLRPEVISSRNAGGMTPLHLAAYWCALDAARLLIARGADVRDASTDDFLQIHPLGSAVATPKVPNPSDDEDRVIAVADLLLDAGADVNARRRDGLTALHTAAYRGHERVIRHLVERGADLTIRARAGPGAHAGMTPQDMAIAEGQMAAVQLLSDLEGR